MHTDLRYPIGQFVQQPFSTSTKESWLAEIKFLPTVLESAVNNLDAQQLHTPYRPDGWTVHEVVHHVADSHMNAYCRFKLGYTELRPTIRPYEEQLWATTHDVQHLPVNISITLLHALHLRWHDFLAHLDDTDWNRTVFHPGRGIELSLWDLLGTYAWHGRHHVAHITGLREREGWM